MDADQPVPDVGRSPVQQVIDSPASAEGPASSVGGGGQPQEAGSSPKKHFRRLVIPAIVGVVIVGVGVGVAVAVFGAPTVPTGAGSATITWHPVPGSSVPPGRASLPSQLFTAAQTGPPQPFGGTIRNLSVTGIATKTPSSTAFPPDFSLSPAPLQRQLFRWSGTFDGRAFNLGLFIELTKQGGAGQPYTINGIYYKVAGRWGPDSVSAVGPYSDQGTPIAFHGTVGALKVSGLVHRPKGNDNQASVVTFTVSR